MLKSGPSVFNRGIMRVSKTHGNGLIDDLPTLPPFYVYFVKCLAVLRMINILFSNVRPESPFLARIEKVNVGNVQEMTQ